MEKFINIKKTTRFFIKKYKKGDTVILSGGNNNRHHSQAYVMSKYIKDNIDIKKQNIIRE